MTLCGLHFEFGVADQELKFKSGQIISGILNVMVRGGGYKTKGITILCFGQASVSWPQGKRRITADEQIFTLYFDIRADPDGHPLEVLTVGHHRFPFTFTLPHSIPSSFYSYRSTHRGIGEVAYMLRAIIHRPLFQLDDKLTINFQVDKSLDLNLFPAAEVSETLEVEGSKNVGCCGCETGPLMMTVRIPHGGYTLGQTVYMTAHFENQSTRRIGPVVAHLLETTTYYAEDTCLTESESKMQLELFNEMSPGQSESRDGPVFQIPGYLVPSKLGRGEGCNIIDLRYNFQVLMTVPWGFNLEVVIPIVIGTVPLISPCPNVDGPT